MNKSEFNKSIVIFLIVISLYSIFCLTKYQYARFTADSMLYFSIAQKYLAGDFQNAINGYWGPLLAWLIIPFLHVGVSDVFTINILNAIFGIITFAGIWGLSERFEISEKIKNVLIVCSLPIVAKFSMVQPMDFLLVSILILYLCIIFNPDYPHKISSGLTSGILGSLAYLTKAYAFPFFIVHFFLMNIFHYLKNSGRKERMMVLRNAIAGFLLFTIISGTWIVIISNKYGHFTFSTMRDTNFNAPGPEAMGGGLEFGVPVFYEGFYAPPNKTAFVVWEDPSYLRGKPWSAWQSFGHFKHFIRLTLKNIADGLKIFESFSTFSMVIIVMYILLFCVRSKEELFSKGTLLYPLFTIILFSGGYVFFHFEERYVWLTNVLLLLMGGHLLTVLFQGDFFKLAYRRNILIIFFVISFVFVPVKYIMQVSRGGIDTEMYLVGADLKKYAISGNIASNREMCSHDAWHKTFRLAYWLDSRYYGQAREYITDTELANELKKFDIDYYFLWSDVSAVSQFLSSYKEVTENKIPGLKIYSLRSPLLPQAAEGKRE